MEVLCEHLRSARLNPWMLTAVYARRSIIWDDRFVLPCVARRFCRLRNICYAASIRILQRLKLSFHPNGGSVE